MVYKERTLKILLSLFPPLLFSRIMVKRISKGYREIDVKLRRSLLNKNFQKTIFGGSIFSAADPFYALMYWQVFAHEGIRSECWLKKAEVDYLKPADTHLWLKFRLSEEDISGTRDILRTAGKVERWHTVQAVNLRGEVCAEIRTLVYLRLRDPSASDAPGI